MVKACVVSSSKEGFVVFLGAFIGYLLDLFVVTTYFGLVVLVLFSIFTCNPVEVVEAVISCDAVLLMFLSGEGLTDNGAYGVGCVCSSGSAHPWN